MRHLNFSLFFIFIFISSLCQADETNLMPSDIARIKQRGELIVAMYYENVPPFAIQHPDNTLDGIDIDLANDIANKLGVKLVLNRDAQTYDEVVMSVATKQVDIGLSSLSNTLDRAMLVSFSTPYWSLKQALLINRLKLSSYKDHPNFKNSELLLNQTGIKIGAIKGSSYIDFANKIFPLATIISYDTLEQGIKDTKASKLLAFLYDEVEVMNWSKQFPEDSLYLKSDFITQSEDTLAIAVHWQDTHLLKWINLYIEQSKYNLLRKLKEKYSD
ncbi:MAG: ABC transporter substrate-binding protein [Methylococcaceae bacterium]|nr:ABC transporter substrate-binding protein [Methylococcaceae bacterium]